MTLENMLMKGLINLEEFTEALPEDSPEPKSDLETIIRKRKEARNMIAGMQEQANALNSAMNQEMINQGGDIDGMSYMQDSGNESQNTDQQQNNMGM
jgi:hypothetical protein